MCSFYGDVVLQEKKMNISENSVPFLISSTQIPGRHLNENKWSCVCSLFKKVIAGGNHEQGCRVILGYLRYDASIFPLSWDSTQNSSGLCHKIKKIVNNY